eukprot:EG_transcript_7193
MQGAVGFAVAILFFICVVFFLSGTVSPSPTLTEVAAKPAGKPLHTEPPPAAVLHRPVPPQVVVTQAVAIIPIAPADTSRSLALVHNMMCALRQVGAWRVSQILAYMDPAAATDVQLPQDIQLYRPNITVDKECAAISVPLHVLESGHSVYWLEPTYVVLDNPFYPPSPHELTLSTTDETHGSKGRRRQHPGPCTEKQTALSFYSAHPTVNAINALRRADFACRHRDSRQYHQPAAAMQSAVHELWLMAEGRLTFGCYDAAIFRAVPSDSRPVSHFRCQTCPAPNSGKVEVLPVMYRSSQMLSRSGDIPLPCSDADDTPGTAGQASHKRARFASQCLQKAFVNLDTTFLDSVTDREFEVLFNRAVRGTDYLRGKHINKFTHGGWAGPWVDDYFISIFSKEGAAFFRPIIPLFINWQDYMQQHDKAADLWETLELVVDPRFPYITVNQHDCGMDRLTNTYPNVIVLSSGGYGHIAVPLIRGERPWPAIAPEKRARDIFWKGEESFHHRARALQMLRHHFNVTPGTNNYEFDLGQHTFGFAGRGHGRTSFRLMELLQAGTIPLYVYDDVPWLPYHPKVDWNRFALFHSLSELDLLVKRVRQLQANVTATT